VIENYQEEQELLEEQEEPADQHFATVAGVYSDGLTLTFDGASGPSTKRYKCNTFVKFAAGDRVFLAKDSGTYVVICKIGNPASSIVADAAKTVDGSWSPVSGAAPVVWLGYSNYELDYSIDGQNVLSAANNPRDQSDRQYQIRFRTDASGNLQFNSGRFGVWKTLANA